MKPLVTIITVCRNSAATIRRTIESVLSQSYDNYQYIVIDAISTDGTLDIIESYRSRFGQRLLLISEHDSGIYDAMNKGISKATGEIIGIINSDDWYEPDAVEHIVTEYGKRSGGVYYGLLRCYSNNDVVMVKSVGAKFLYAEHVGHPAYFVSKSVYDLHGKFSLKYRYASDYELMLRFISRKIEFYSVDSIVANYSYGGASSKQEKYTFEEYILIRYQYGYLSAVGCYFRIWRNRMYFLLRWILLRK